MTFLQNGDSQITSIVLNQREIMKISTKRDVLDVLQNYLW